MQLTDLYQSDFSQLGDAELAALAKEIEDGGVLDSDYEGYDRDWDEGTWQYQAANRYYKILGEKRRRYRLLHPEETDSTLDLLMMESLRQMGRTLADLVPRIYEAQRDFDGEFRKIGGALTTRTPARFRSNN